MNTYILFLLIFSIPLVNLFAQKETEKTIIILLGPPASGKGTQASRLAKEFHIPHISTGDLFRENMSRQTELGKKAKSFMDKGQLVPDSLVLDMFFDRVSKSDSAHGYVLDGFPRTIPQAEALDRFLTGNERLIVLNLNVSDETLIKRTSGRRSCPSCKAVYNIYYSPSKQEAICDKCGGELIMRDDDKPEIVKERLRVYANETRPLIDYYKKKGAVKDIDGEKNPDDVFNELKHAVSQ